MFRLRKKRKDGIFIFIIFLIVVFLGIISMLKITDIFVLALLGLYLLFNGIRLLIIALYLIITGKKIINKELTFYARHLYSQLSNSPTKLTKKNVKKIHQFLPVPSDYKILWAEIQSFGNHPAGIVITDQAIIIKLPKNVIKEKNKEIINHNKKAKKEDRKSKIPYIYRIINWEYFSPADYVLDQKDNNYLLVIDEETVFPFVSEELFLSFESLKQSYTQIEQNLQGFEVSSVFSAINTINVESTMYSAKNGAANTKTGHGIIAEDYGTILDKLSGNDATVVGRDNAKNGPDKIVNGVAIQCKYCKTAVDSVNACFEGDFRYYDLNDEPMKIEVPKDQYAEAISIMRNKIIEGKVPNVSDPNKAEDIIREGRFTYNQVLNLAKAGTIESIKYDLTTSSIRCISVFGISFLITFAQVFWVTKDIKLATKKALITAARIYGLSLIGSVISSQLARAGIANLFYPLMKNLLDNLPDQVVGKIANNTKGFVNPSAISVDASRNYFARFLSSQVSTQCVMFLIFSTPDIYRVISSNISGGQFVMNMSERLVGTVAGGTAGSLVGGAIGNAINPFVGGIAGVTAGTIVGTASSIATKTIAHLFRETNY